VKFPIWDYDYDGLISNLKLILKDSGVKDKWQIPDSNLDSFLLSIRSNYQGKWPPMTKKKQFFDLNFSIHWYSVKMSVSVKNDMKSVFDPKMTFHGQKLVLRPQSVFIHENDLSWPLCM